MSTLYLIPTADFVPAHNLSAPTCGPRAGVACFGDYEPVDANPLGYYQPGPSAAFYPYVDEYERAAHRRLLQQRARARAVAAERERQRALYLQRQRQLQLVALEQERQRQRALRIEAARRQALIREYSARQRQRKQELEQAEVATLLTHVLADLFSQYNDHRDEETTTRDDNTRIATRAEPQPPRHLERDELARQAAARAQQVVNDEADLASFQSVFNNLFGHVFGDDEHQAQSHQEGVQEKSAENELPSNTRNIPVLSRTPSPALPSNSPADDPAEEAPVLPEAGVAPQPSSPIAADATTAIPIEHVPSRPASPALSTHSAKSASSDRSTSSKRSSQSARKLAHVRDADENGEEILLPEDTATERDEEDGFVELSHSDDGESTKQP